MSDKPDNHDFSDGEKPGGDGASDNDAAADVSLSEKPQAERSIIDKTIDSIASVGLGPLTATIDAKGKADLAFSISSDLVKLLARLDIPGPIEVNISLEQGSKE